MFFAMMQAKSFINPFLLQIITPRHSYKCSGKEVINNGQALYPVYYLVDLVGRHIAAIEHIRLIRPKRVFHRFGCFRELFHQADNRGRFIRRFRIVLNE